MLQIACGTDLAQSNVLEGCLQKQLGTSTVLCLALDKDRMQTHTLPGTFLGRLQRNKRVPFEMH